MTGKLDALAIDVATFRKLDSSEIETALRKIASDAPISNLIAFLEISGIVETGENDVEIRGYLVNIFVERQSVLARKLVAAIETDDL